VCSRGVGSIAAKIPTARVAMVIVLAVGVAGCGAAHDSPQFATSSLSAFAVLRVPRSHDDEVPPWVEHLVLEGHEPVLSAADIQGARGVLPRQQGWLIQAPEGGLCLVRMIYPLVSEVDGESLPPSVSRSCSSAAAAEAGQLFQTQSLSTTFVKRMPTRVIGIVPDGVDHVAVRFAGNASKRVAVVRNAYETIVINPHSVSFVAKRAGRRRRYVVHLPSVAGASPTPYRAHSG
jgi:hypothetical protein